MDKVKELTPAETAFHDAVRNLSIQDQERIMRSEVSANECVQSSNMAAAVNAWNAVLVERGQEPPLMYIRV